MTFFSHFSKFYLNFCFCTKSTFFSNFSEFLLVSKYLSGCPLYPGGPGPSSSFSSLFMRLPLFFDILYTHFLKTPSLDGPRLDARGRRTPLCTRLSSSNNNNNNNFTNGLNVTYYVSRVRDWHYLSQL